MVLEQPPFRVGVTCVVIAAVVVSAFLVSWIIGVGVLSTFVVLPVGPLLGGPEVVPDQGDQVAPRPPSVALLVVIVAIVGAVFVAYWWDWRVGVGLTAFFMVVPVSELLIDAAGVPAERVYPSMGVLPPGVSDSATSQGPLLQLVDQCAVVTTALRPEGTVEIEGERHTARSDFGFVDPGQEVVVTGVASGRLLVRVVEGL